MQIIKKIDEWKRIRKSLDNKTLGFVPTMGNLHEGHLSLLERSVSENDVTVMSCFVNPTQFNNANDFAYYPRTLKEDSSIAEQAKVDYFFMPEYASLYPEDYRYRIVETEYSQCLEGMHRPGHFEGMMTVVLKLLLLTRSNRAYFGEKDFQQLQLVKGLVEAFFLDTEIVACKTVRNDFNLPLSSRNNRLTPEQLEMSRYFPEQFHSKKSCDEIKARLTEKGFTVEYIAERNGRRFAAVKLGDIRLIDNVEVDAC